MSMISRRPGIRALAFASASLLVLALAGCADDDNGAFPANGAGAGSTFGQALAKDYADLSAQAAAAPVPDSDESFFENPFGLFGSSANPNDLLITAFNDKADLARQGQEPAPEMAPADPTAQAIRERLLRALAAGKDQFPQQAARAQADYDCWVLDSNVPDMVPAAQACRTSLDGSLLALETAARPAPPPMAAPIAAPLPPAPSDYTAYFELDSWTLTAEDLTVITKVINTARTGGQTHITVVGHTDTSGSAGYNQKLSVRRANVVVEALVDLGARRAAIRASGVGENDLAIQTPDNTKEAKNRRAVIGLQP